MIIRFVPGKIGKKHVTPRNTKTDGLSRIEADRAIESIHTSQALVKESESKVSNEGQATLNPHRLKGCQSVKSTRAAFVAAH